MSDTVDEALAEAHARFDRIVKAAENTGRLKQAAEDRAKIEDAKCAAWAEGWRAGWNDNRNGHRTMNPYGVTRAREEATP